jgi:hypothetical protein
VHDGLEYLSWTSFKICLSSLCCHGIALIRVCSFFYQYIQNILKLMNLGQRSSKYVTVICYNFRTNLLFLHIVISFFFLPVIAGAALVVMSTYFRCISVVEIKLLYACYISAPPVLSFNSRIVNTCLVV